MSYICVGFTLLGWLASPHLWSPSCPYQSLINHFQDSHQACLVTAAVLGINRHCTSPQRAVPYFCCPPLVMMTPSLDFEGHMQAVWCKLVVTEANQSGLTSLFSVVVIMSIISGCAVFSSLFYAYASREEQHGYQVQFCLWLCSDPLWYYFELIYDTLRGNKLMANTCV